MDLQIEQFSPTKAELTKLVEAAKVLILPDPSDKAQLRKIKDARLNIRDARVAITKTGKALREDALKFSKAVIAKEKELVAIIEPEENRLAELEAVAEKAAVRKERMELVPHRMARLEALADGQPFPGDDVLLDMDGPAFENYYNVRVADKNEVDRQRIEAEDLKNKEDAAKLDREKEMREREEKARQEERERLEREQKEKEEREQREKDDAERKEREEKERLKSEESYQAFLKQHGYTEETESEFKIDKSYVSGKTVIVKLYKLVGTHKVN